jgi:DinB family protein
MRVLTITFGMLMAGATGLWSQQNPLSAEVKRMYEGTKNNLTRAAEKVPEDVYSFKPVPTVRTFGEEVGHAAEWNMISCASAKGEPATNPAAGKTSKADLMAALKSAFDYCDAVYNSLNDASATQMADFRGRQQSRLATLYFNVSHNNETYGTMVPYMRIKGIIPPSSEPRR